MLPTIMESPLTGGKMTLQWEWRDMEFRKEKFRVMFPFYKCEDSGEQFTTNESDAVWYAQVHNQYCCKYGIPYPDEIQSLRERYGVSAARMSAILGFGPNQWRLYEQEEIPSVSNGRMIRSVMNPAVFRDLVLNSKSLIGEAECNKILARITGLNVDTYVDYETKRLFAFPRGLENGYGDLSLTRLNNVMLYVLNSCKDVWFTKMNKILFYIDFTSYKELGHSITGLAFRAIEYGPVPERWERIYSGFDNIRQEVRCAGDYEGIVLTTTAKCDCGKFTSDEIEIIKTVCQKLGDKSANALSELSHNEVCWQQCHQAHQIIPYWYAFEIK